MKPTLNYTFKRRTKNHLDWLLNVIKSEKYFLAEGYILTVNLKHNKQ
ncbi:hypothetical protein LRR18_07780 [Mangrovimonas sp. AS39]|nr:MULTISPECIES: hypothetical protein [Mangrovimonas]MCF1191479.1 hypothetical protein [Mangrovimonas futianensis]MCF1195174.1 hypothetical protein [Mangrovimonas futianensis]NIK92284.1 hypothetical protein [Mangrovimonas sp. CR14]